MKNRKIFQAIHCGLVVATLFVVLATQATPAEAQAAGQNCPALTDLFDVCTGGEVFMLYSIGLSENAARGRARNTLRDSCTGRACCDISISCVEFGAEGGVEVEVGPVTGNLGGNGPQGFRCQPFARKLEMNPCNPKAPGFKGREAQCRQQYCSPNSGCGHDTEEGCEAACERTYGCESHCELSGATAKWCCKKGEDPNEANSLEDQLFEALEKEFVLASTEPLMDVTAFVEVPEDDNCDGREDEGPGDPPRRNDDPPRQDPPGRDEEDDGPIRCLDNEPCQIVCPDGTFNQGRRTCYDDGSDLCAGVCVSDGDWRPAEDGGGGGCIVEPGAGCPADCASCNYTY
jgi:hypothetical protein